MIPRDKREAFARRSRAKQNLERDDDRPNLIALSGSMRERHRSILDREWTAGVPALPASLIWPYS
jgi:hypothetical protein